MTIRASIIVCNPDIIIIGTDFPDFDGPDLCQRIKKDPLIPSVSVILTSSVRDEIKIAKGFDKKLSFSCQKTIVKSMRRMINSGEIVVEKFL